MGERYYNPRDIKLRYGDYEWCPYDQSAKWVNPDRTKEKSSHPYSYDEFFIFGSRDIIKGDGIQGNYSDRIWEWDYHKANKLWEEHVGTRFAQASRLKLSKFMSEFHGKKVEVVALAEGCNISNGYPYHIVWYKELE